MRGIEWITLECRFEAYASGMAERERRRNRDQGRIIGEVVAEVPEVSKTRLHIGRTIAHLRVDPGETRLDPIDHVATSSS
jgi:hypothetical protein